MPTNREIEVVCNPNDPDKWEEKGTDVDATALVTELNRFQRLQPGIQGQQTAKIKLTIEN